MLFSKRIDFVSLLIGVLITVFVICLFTGISLLKFVLLGLLASMLTSGLYFGIDKLILEEFRNK